MAKVMELQKIEVWDGNMAASQAMRQAQIDVVCKTMAHLWAMAISMESL